MRTERHLSDGERERSRLQLLSSYADDERKRAFAPDRVGRRIVGQWRRGQAPGLITDIPHEVVRSRRRCFKAAPRTSWCCGAVRKPGQGRHRAASIDAFTPLQITFLEQLTASIGIVLNSIEATMPDRGFLKQSQQTAGELQAQQRELQQTNEQFGAEGAAAGGTHVEVERKNRKSSSPPALEKGRRSWR